MEARKYKESGGDVLSQVLDLLSESDKVMRPTPRTDMKILINDNHISFVFAIILEAGGRVMMSPGLLNCYYLFLYAFVTIDTHNSPLIFKFNGESQFNTHLIGFPHSLLMAMVGKTFDSIFTIKREEIPTTAADVCLVTYPCTCSAA